MSRMGKAIRWCIVLAAAVLLAAGALPPEGPILAERPLLAEGPLLEQREVFRAGEDGYHTYRIPALTVTKKGTLLAFCEARRNNQRDHGDIDLVVKRSTDGGKSWSAQKVVYEEGGKAEITIGNPSPVVDRDTGTIWLPMCRDNRDVLITKSTDDGLTWSKPVDITRSVKKPDWGWYATGPGIGIQLRGGPHKGRLIIPCDHREPVGDRMVKKSHVFYSDDHGKTWQLGGSVDEHTDECQLVETADGSLLVNMRNYWEHDGHQSEKGGKRATARSRDGGQTWTDLQFDATLIEPTCQASFLRYTHARYTDAKMHGKNRLLFSNPASQDDRIKMTVRMSYDEGKTWPVGKLLNEGQSAYSSLAVLSDNTIGCLYERGREHPYEKITFARFNLAWLTDGSDRLK